MRTIICTFLLIFFTQKTVFARDVLQPNPISDEMYAETYTVVSSMNDGSFILMQYLFTNAGLGSQKAGCRILLIPNGQQAKNVTDRVSKENWRFDPSTRSLKVSKCNLSSQNGQTKFSAQHLWSGSQRFKFDRATFQQMKVTKS